MAAVGSGNVWGLNSQIATLGGDTDAGDYPVYLRELIPSSSSIYEVLELLGMYPSNLNYYCLLIYAKNIQV